MLGEGVTAQEKAVLINLIKERRSVRSYMKKPVPISVVKEIIDTAKWAPSAHNAQPWRFIILTEGLNREHLIRSMLQSYLKEMIGNHIPQSERDILISRSEQRLRDAPGLVIVCSTMPKMNKYKDRSRYILEQTLVAHSLGAVMQNVLLSAHAFGLGACWYCSPLFCQKAVQQALELPSFMEPQALVTLGYPKDYPSGKERKNTDSIITVK